MMLGSGVGFFYFIFIPMILKALPITVLTYPQVTKQITKTSIKVLNDQLTVQIDLTL